MKVSRNSQTGELWEKIRFIQIRNKSFMFGFSHETFLNFTYRRSGNTAFSTKKGADLFPLKENGKMGFTASLYVMLSDV